MLPADMRMKKTSQLLVSLSLLGILGASSYGVSQIRLMGGDSPCSGRLEIHNNNSWEAVCYQPSTWELPISGKDFKQMGCGTVLQLIPEIPFNQTPEAFIEYDMKCFGISSNTRCNYSMTQTDNCDSRKYIVINSSNSAISDMRLVDGSSSSDGILEIYFNHIWHRVPSEGHSLDDRVAQVACKQLRGGISLQRLSLSSDSSHSLPVACTGEEHHLSDCLTYTESPFSYTSRHLGMICSKPAPPINIRLVGGGESCAGQAEVFAEDSWKMICYEGQETRPAAMVCKEMGCGSAVHVMKGFGLWSTVGQVWRYYFRCQDHESRLSECKNEWKEDDPCNDPEDTFGVTCSGSSVSRVRLVNGSHSCEGSVEVYYNNTWGTVCDHSWDIRDAAVVCRQVGCGPALEATAGVAVGAHSGPVWLDNVFCTGLEMNLSLCASQMLLQNQCTSRQAGVRCSPSGISNVRLVNGSSRCAGRLEVYFNGAWGTVCNEDWDSRDASVVCKQLGCGPAAESTRQNPYGPGSSPVWLRRVFCGGSESYLSQCGSHASQQFACSHLHDVGITCLGANTVISNVRLVSGSRRCAGNVEVFANNTWGRVHSDLSDHMLWDLADASVVCKQLECGPLLEVSTKQDSHEKENYISMRGKELNFYMTDHRGDKYVNVKYSPWGIFCSGTESSISQCGTKKMSLQPYQHIKVECSDSGISGVRLVDGGSSCAGRVEVNYSNTWGTICDYRWDIEAAAVVCKELGCGSALEALHGAHFKPGSGPVWLKAVFCSGNETHFSHCGAVMSERYPCDHSQDAGVICSGPELFWTSSIFRFIIYTLVLASIHLGFFLYGYLEDKGKRGYTDPFNLLLSRQQE